MEVEGKVGLTRVKPGMRQALRLDEAGGLVSTNAHGAFHEAANQHYLYFAANQTAVTTTVALAAVYTGLCISNPAGSGRNLSILKVNWVFTVAPAAISSIHIGGGYTSAGVTVHTTPLTVYNAALGAGEASVANADAACTLVGTPIYIQPLVGGFTAAVLYPHQSVIDIDGAILVPPGGYVFIATLTVCVGFGSICWEEIPI